MTKSSPRRLETDDYPGYQRFFLALFAQGRERRSRARKTSGTQGTLDLMNHFFILINKQSVSSNPALSSSSVNNVCVFYHHLSVLLFIVSSDWGLLLLKIIQPSPTFNTSFTYRTSQLFEILEYLSSRKRLSLENGSREQQFRSPALSNKIYL